MAQVNTPWKNSMGGVPLHIPYFNGSLYDALAISADKRPNAIALDFMGKSTRYRTFLQNIHTCANALWHMGIRPGDRVTIAMPNCPQALVFFYGINLLGGNFAAFFRHIRIFSCIYAQELITYRC